MGTINGAFRHQRPKAKIDSDYCGYKGAALRRKLRHRKCIQYPITSGCEIEAAFKASCVRLQEQNFR
jgi:hypothetical protein